MANIRTVLKQSLYGQDCCNVWHFQGPPGALGNLHAAIESYFTTWLIAFQDAELEYVSFTSTNLDDMTQLTTASTLVGTGIGDAAATQLAGVISWRTAYVGRRYRGRTYIAGLSDTYITAGKFLSTLTTAMQGFGDDLIGSLGVDAGYGLMVYSRVLDQMIPAVTCVARDIPYTQRRRTIGRGS